jgi:endonuclease/exonuclease/phosphatase family metal-dependent hydrolase
LADLAKIDPSLNPTFHYKLDSKFEGSNHMIDYIFTSQNCEVKRFEVVFNKEADYVSDHSGILVEI